MKLEDLDKKYYCPTCNTYQYSEATCTTCGKEAQHCGYKMNVSMSNYRLNIIDQRKEHRNALVQPYRQGEFSKEFRDANPEVAKNMVKEGVITKQQHDKAKEVWGKDDII